MSSHLDALIARAELIHHAEPIRAAARPAAYLEVDPSSPGEPLGTRLGGDPALPPAMEWPVDGEGRPFRFVLQIAVRDIPRDWEGHVLRPASWPADGILALFTGLSASSAPLPHVVILHSGEGAVVRPSPPRSEGTYLEVDFAESVPPARMIVHPGWDLPRWASEEWAHLDEEVFDGEDDQVAFEALGWLIEPVPAADIIGRLFGHVAGIGYDPRESIGGAEPLSAWQHLLTLDSSLRVELTIGDAGYLQVLALGRAIDAGELTGTWASAESS